MFVWKRRISASGSHDTSTASHQLNTGRSPANKRTTSCEDPIALSLALHGRIRKPLEEVACAVTELASAGGIARTSRSQRAFRLAPIPLSTPSGRVLFPVGYSLRTGVGCNTLPAPPGRYVRNCDLA